MAGIIGLVGSVVSAIGTIASGQAAARQAQYQAAQERVNAGYEQARGQQNAMAYDRQKQLALSRVQALAGAGGLGGTDPTISTVEGDIAQYGELQSRTAQFAGDIQAQASRSQATGLDMQAQADETGAMFGAMGSILGGFGGMFKTYGQGGPGGSSAPYGAYSGAMGYG